MAENGKINLLYVITKLELGGAQKHLLTLLQSLDANRFRLFLFTSNRGELFDQVINIQGLKFYRCAFMDRPVNPIKDLLSFLLLCLFIKKNNIHIVHTHSSKAGILGRLAAKTCRVKSIIHSVHGWSFNDYQFKCVSYLYAWLERFCARFTDRIVVFSECDKGRGLERRIGNKEKYIFIRHGIAPDDFRSNSFRHKIRKDLGFPEDNPVIGSVACFKPQKAPLDFVKSAYLLKRIFPKTKFLMVGDGILGNKLVRLIRELDLSNDFVLTGWRRDIPLILSAIDIFALTSLWEGMPIAVLEAMAAGVPVVATDTGGIREVISENVNGFLVRPGDTQAFCDRIARLLEDCNLRESFVRKSASIIKRPEFLAANMLKEVERIYLNCGSGVCCG